MIWYKSSIQERSSPLGAKMGRGSPVCQQIREKIIEMFKNNVPQRKIGRDLDISPSTVHNIIKRFKESGGISVRKGQGRKPKLNNRDLRSLRRHCIKNRHSSISDITTWAQDYFGKPLSSTTIRSYIHKCQLKLYCAKRKPYVNSVQSIENVWRILKRKMRQRRPRTVAHLKTCLQEEWDKITPETLHHLVSSVPKRLLSVVKRNGNITKW